jgi:PadR family transcriptional regulator, regulatory protein AphA
MDIKYAILGFLSWQSFTGYELKKIVANSEAFYWSGNNNQIYTALVQLHKEGLVTNEVQHQERLPSRKIYTITSQGLASLKEWVLTSPELPQMRKSFLVQLAWSDQLSSQDLDTLLEKYQNEIRMQILMHREQNKRGALLNPARTPREKFLWEMISRNLLQSHETELSWVTELREGLKTMGGRD